MGAGKTSNQGTILSFTFDEEEPPYRSRGAVRYAPGKAGNAVSLHDNAYIYLQRTVGEPTAIPCAKLKELLRGSSIGEFDKLVFIKRYTYTSNHYYAEFVNSLWMPGGNLCIFDLKTGTVRDLLPEMATGVFGRFDVSFDAKRIVFGWKASPAEGYRIYEVNVDGTGLRQLTFPPANERELQKKYYLHSGSMKHYHRGTDDMHPCYLPDGGIAFTSTRCLTSTLCHPGDGITTSNVYRMDADGRIACSTA